MTKQTINVGATANDRTGDSLRTAFNKVNENFTELYVALGLDNNGLNLGAFTFTGSVLSTDDSTNITIDRPVTVNGEIKVHGDITPERNDINLGSSSKPFKSLYVSNNTIYIGGSALGINQSGQLTVAGSEVGGSTDRLSNGGDEVVLIGGANPYTLFPAITGGDQLQIQGAEVSSVSGGLALTSQGNLNIISNGSGTAPGGSKNWTFGNDGNLSLPWGGSILAYDTGAVDLAAATGTDSYIGMTYDYRNWMWVDTDGAYIRSSNGDTIKTWTFGTNGSLTFPNSTVQTTAWTGDQTVSTTSSVKFNTIRSNILAPLTTGATRYTIANIAPESPWTNPVITITGTIGPEWVNGSQLEITGVTTPTQANGTWYVQYRSANSFRLFNDAGLTSSPNASSWAAYTGSGIVKLPDSPANLTVVNNSNTWTFGTNGSLTFPNATVQTTAWAGIPGPYADDSAAATAGVAVGYPYHKTGTSGQVFVRLS